MMKQQINTNSSSTSRKNQLITSINMKFGSIIAIVTMSLCCLFIFGCIALIASARAEPMSMSSEQAEQNARISATLAVVENPETTVRVLENLLRSILYSVSADLQAQSGPTQKRGLDLGISRGYSGSQAGKHLMGLSAASFANGPGRR